MWVGLATFMFFAFDQTNHSNLVDCSWKPIMSKKNEREKVCGTKWYCFKKSRENKTSHRSGYQPSLCKKKNQCGSDNPKIFSLSMLRHNGFGGRITGNSVGISMAVFHKPQRGGKIPAPKHQRCCWQDKMGGPTLHQVPMAETGRRGAWGGGTD